jgi:hypothetical protein
MMLVKLCVLIVDNLKGKYGFVCLHFLLGVQSQRITRIKDLAYTT